MRQNSFEANMPANADFKDLFKVLNAENVEYLVPFPKKYLPERKAVAQEAERLSAHAGDIRSQGHTLRGFYACPISRRAHNYVRAC